MDRSHERDEVHRISGNHHWILRNNPQIEENLRSNYRHCNPSSRSIMFVTEMDIYNRPFPKIELDKADVDWIYYFLFKTIAITIIVVFVQLSTAAVAYTVTTDSTSSTVKPWKWYHWSGIDSGFLYLITVWQLDCVISVLENSQGTRIHDQIDGSDEVLYIVTPWKSHWCINQFGRISASFQNRWRYSASTCISRLIVRDEVAGAAGDAAWRQELDSYCWKVPSEGWEAMQR